MDVANRVKAASRISQKFCALFNLEKKCIRFNWLYSLSIVNNIICNTSVIVLECLVGLTILGKLRVSDSISEWPAMGVQHTD